MRIAHNYLIFGNVNTRDCGVWISGTGTFDAPERDISFVSVPGRNGSLTIDNGCFKNIKVQYPAFIPSDFQNKMADFRAKMRALPGYQRLEDTYTPDLFRMAVFVDAMKPKTTAANMAAEFNLDFNCKPQRYLKVGEEWVTVSSGDYLRNPTPYEALPILRVYGAGTFYVGGTPVQITESTDYTDIDCELQDAYRGLNNRNAYVKLLNGVFPSLPAGNTGITYTGITRIDVMPRWYTI